MSGRPSLGGPRKSLGGIPTPRKVSGPASSAQTRAALQASTNEAQSAYAQLVEGKDTFKVPAAKGQASVASLGLRSQTPVSDPRSAASTPSKGSKTPVGYATPAKKQWSGPLPIQQVSLPSLAAPLLEIGDSVTAMQYEGTLRYLGPVGDKPGDFGGIELSGEWVGKGKNNGSVQGFVF